MSIDRVSTAHQSALMLRQLTQAGNALEKTNQQIASGVVSSNYAGFGSQTQVLQATISANDRNAAYQTATKLATTQADLQDTQLTTLSDLAAKLKVAVSNSVANNDPTTLMAQAESIFSQAVGILNSKDANGDYIYGGGKTDTAPMTVSSLSGLAGLGSVSGAFANGSYKKAVQVGDGQSVTFGVLASDVGTGLMQALKDIATFDAGGAGNFNGSTNLSQAQSTFLTAQITSLVGVNTNLNTATAQNGYNFSALKNATSQQDEMKTLYSGFIEELQDTNMVDAATQLSLNQTQLQAALQVTAGLHQISLLNFMK